MFIEQPPEFFRKLYPGAVWRMDPNEKAVYLTFDDGPIPEVTPWVLDLLDKHNIKATFFMVCLAMIDAMKYWIQEVGVDGFRCDAADYVPYTFWKQAVDSLRAIPNRKLLMLAEGKRKDHFDAGFDMNYAWDLMEAMRDVFVNDSSAARLLEVDWSEYDSIPAGKMKLRFITNHDEASKMSPIVELGSERAAMAAFVGTVFCMVEH